MNFFQKIKVLTKDPGGPRQPVYPRITLDEIPPASALLFYNGNKLTERAGRAIFKHPYWPPAFHAAIYVWNHLCLNVNKFKTLEDVTEGFNSNRRIDVVIYHELTDEQRKEISREAALDASPHKMGLVLPDYAVTDYLRFLFRKLPPSRKDFCSENVVELFGRAPAHGVRRVSEWYEAVKASGGIRIAPGLPVDTTPWDIQEGAETGFGGAELRTLHLGPDYPF